MSCEQNSPVVGIIMGSESDMPAMEPCMKQLDEFGVPYEVKVASAHRKPAEVHEWASSAHERGIRVIVAAAGKAAHPGGPCLSRLHPTRFSCPYASLSEAYYMVSRTLQHFPWRRHVWGKEAIGNHG